MYKINESTICVFEWFEGGCIGTTTTKKKEKKNFPWKFYENIYLNITHIKSMHFKMLRILSFRFSLFLSLSLLSLLRHFFSPSFLFQKPLFPIMNLHVTCFQFLRLENLENVCIFSIFANNNKKKMTTIICIYAIICTGTGCFFYREQRHKISKTELLRLQQNMHLNCWFFVSGKIVHDLDHFNFRRCRMEKEEIVVKIDFFSSQPEASDVIIKKKKVLLHKIRSNKFQLNFEKCVKLINILENTKFDFASRYSIEMKLSSQIQSSNSQKLN